MNQDKIAAGKQLRAIWESLTVSGVKAKKLYPVIISGAPAFMQVKQFPKVGNPTLHIQVLIGSQRWGRSLHYYKVQGVNDKLVDAGRGTFAGAQEAEWIDQHIKAMQAKGAEDA